jgi:hypothetical protein
MSRAKRETAGRVGFQRSRGLPHKAILPPSFLTASTKTERSSSLESVYPSLEKLFAKSSWRGCPTVVSLGDKGYYFIRVGNAYYYSLPSSITGAVKDWTQVRRLWLGHEDAYVLEKFDGSYSWNLHKKPGTYYEDMTTHLKVGDNGCTTVKVGAADSRVYM